MAVAVTPAGHDESLPALLGDDPADVVVGRTPGQVAVVMPLVGTHLSHNKTINSKNDSLRNIINHSLSESADPPGSLNLTQCN